MPTVKDVQLVSFHELKLYIMSSYVLLYFNGEFLLEVYIWCVFGQSSVETRKPLILVYFRVGCVRGLSVASWT